MEQGTNSIEIMNTAKIIYGIHWSVSDLDNISAVLLSTPDNGKTVKLYSWSASAQRIMRLFLYLPEFKYIRGRWSV